MAGTMLLAMVFYTLCIALLCFAVGTPINYWGFPVAVSASVATILCVFGTSKRSWRVVVLTLVSLAAASVVCSMLTDQSYDGNAYHGETIGRLLDGWNPVKETADTPTVWVNCYAKALEIAEASVAALTGNMESGKVVNLMLAGAALLLTGGVLRLVYPSLSKKRVAIVVLLFSANPVLITQLFTYYNDYALYCCILIVGTGMLRMYRMGWSWFWAAITLAATMIGMVTKFTHGFYLGIEWDAFLLLLVISRRSVSVIIRSASIAAAGALFGLCVLGYHPYVTNAQRFGHPLYPLMGDNVEDIMSGNTPIEFQEGGRIVNFVKSMTMSRRITYDQRYGGFGPYMYIMLLASVVLIAGSWRVWQALYVSLCLLISCFVFEQTWWARYIPYLWAVIPVSVLTSMIVSVKAGLWQKPVRCIIYVCALLTLPHCVVDAVGLKIEATMYRRLLYEEARRSGVVNVAIEPYNVHVRRRLDEAGLKYNIIRRCEIDTTRALFLTNDGFRGDVIELSPTAFRDITTPGSRYKLVRMHKRTLDFHDDMHSCD